MDKLLKCVAENLGCAGNFSTSWSGVKENLDRICDQLLSEAEQCIDADTGDTLSDKVSQICRQCKLAIEDRVSSCTAESVDDHLQHVQQSLAVLSECQLVASAYVQHTIQRTPSTTERTHSLGCAIALALDVAHEALQHCQESGSSYGLLFSALESELLNVFLQSYNSLKVCFTHLEQLVVRQDVDTGLLLSVWRHLQHVASASVHFDTTLMVKSWRSLLRYYSKLQSNVQGELEIHESLTVLSETLVDRLRGTVAAAVGDGASSPPSGASPNKVVSFLASAMTTLVQNVGVLSEEESRLLLETVLVSHSCTAPLFHCLPRDETACAALLATVRQLTTAVLNRLLASWDRVLPVLVELANEQDGTKLLGVLHCSLWFFDNFSQLPEAVREQLIAPSSPDQIEMSQFSLLELLFQALPHCQAQLSLSSGFAAAPAAATSEQSPSESGPSLYQYVFDTVTRFVVSLTSREFMACLEWGLLQQVLDGWYPACTMLARDLFIFLARLGTSSLRVSYVLFLVKLINSLPASLHHGYRSLVGLARSLFAVLSEKECTVALDRLSQIVQEKNSVVWSLVDFSKVPEGQLLRVVPGIVIPMLKHLSYWHQQPGLSDPAELICALETMTNVCSDVRCLEAMPAGQRASLCKLVLVLWKRLMASLCDVETVSEAALRASQLLLEWCSYLIPVMATGEVRSLLLIYHDHLLSCPHPDVLAGLPSAIAAWGGRELPPNEQDDFLDVMGSLCQATLSSPHWSVHQSALLAFTAFAKVTPYAEAVETKFMPADLSETVVAYLQQLPRDADITSHQNLEKLAAVFSSRQQHMTERKHVVDTHMEPSSHIALKASMQSIATSLAAVSKCLDAPPGGSALPDWLSSQLIAAHREAGVLVEKCSSINACADVGSQLVQDIDDRADTEEED